MSRHARVPICQKTNFCLDKDSGNCPRRAFGVMVDETTGEGSLHMVTAHIGWTNQVIGGVACKDLRRVDQWDERCLFLVRSCNQPGTFLDPLGFLHPLRENAS